MTTYKCVSQCVACKRARIEVVFVGPAAGVGIPKIAVSESYGDIDFHDNNQSDTIDPSRFNGSAGNIGIGVEIGNLGISANRTRLGNAFSTGTGGNQTGGMNVGIELTLGSSTVTSVLWESCK